MPTAPLVPPSIAGAWQPVRAELDAEPVPELVIRQTRVELTADRYAVYFDGQLADRGNYMLSVSPETSHALLTLHGVEGPNAGRTVPAIYQIVGDRLRICYGLVGIAPTAFATAADSRLYLVTYRRFQ